MDTTRNRSAVLAKFLRHAEGSIRSAAVPRSDTVGASNVLENGLLVLANVAEELEAVALGAAPSPAPDPEAGTHASS